MEGDYLILIRHGQTNYNKAGICQGQMIDSCLNTKGKIQAHEFARLASHIQDEFCTSGIRMYSSPMNRARQTAEIVKGESCVELQKNGITLDDRLKEGNMGSGHGFTVDEWYEIMPSDATWRNIDKWNNKFPGGESYSDIFERVKEFIDEIPEGPCVVVTHEMVSKCIRGYHSPDIDMEDIPALKHEQNCIYAINRKTGSIDKFLITGGHVDLD